MGIECLYVPQLNLKVAHFWTDHRITLEVETPMKYGGLSTSTWGPPQKQIVIVIVSDSDSKQ